MCFMSQIGNPTTVKSHFLGILNILNVYKSALKDVAHL